jgi:PAS domain S-box-containing protein
MRRNRAPLHQGAPQQAIALEAAQMRAVLDSIPARIALLDRRRRYRYVNQEFAAFVGGPAEVMIGRTAAQVIGAKAYEQLRDYGTRALAGETVRWEGWLTHEGPRATDGPRFLQRVYLPYRTGSGAIEGYFVFTRDLTELKRSERELAERIAALQASEAVSGAILASALDCVIVIDEAGVVVTFNAAAEQTFGYREADILGRPIGELIVPPALRPRHAEGFRRYLKTGQGSVLGRRIEIDGMRADCSIFPVELAITEVRLPERRLFTAYLRDLTEAKAAAAEIERQRQALQQAERLAALENLLAGVAHELNNPLAIVISHALMLEEEAQESAAPGLADRTARVRAAAERCARILRDFLTTARRAEEPGAIAAPLRPVSPLQAAARVSARNN